MLIDVKKFARTQFQNVLALRRKTISPPLLNQLETAFALDAIQKIIDGPRDGLPLRRYENVHRRQIGTLARCLGHLIAQTAPSEVVLADHVRSGYSTWKQTDNFQKIGRRYHRPGDCEERVKKLT